jgi:hypothetical protein
MTDSKPPVNSTKFPKKKDKIIRLTGIKIIISASVIVVATYGFISLGYASTVIANLKNVFSILPPSPKEEAKTNPLLHDAPLANSALAASAVSQVPINVATRCQKMAPPAKNKPRWIGAKIQKVYEKHLTNYCNDTTLVITDHESSDAFILRNVDQNLKSEKNEGADIKKNSFQLTARLFRAETSKLPICLRIYGERDTEESEVINIIQIASWKSNKKYDQLTSEERDHECARNPDK